MALTIADLLANKTIRRGDQGMKIKLEDIHFIPGFNPRKEGPRLQLSIIEDATFTLENGIKNMPQLKVIPREEGGVWAIDGHRRTLNVRMAIKMGADLTEKDGFVWLPIKPFVGDMNAMNLEVLTSRRGLDLTPMEAAIQFERLANNPDDPLTETQIAKRSGYSRQYVNQMLVLIKQPQELQDMVDRGEVTADIAQAFARTHGDNALEMLKKELAKAQTLGAKKVTKGSILGKALPRKVVEDITERVQVVVNAIPPESRDILEQYRSEKITDGDTMVSMPVRELLALVLCQDNISDVREEMQRKAQARIERAADRKADAERIAETE